MSVRNILMAAAGSADDKLYVDDVFSTYLYTPPAGSGYHTITTGIDYTKGALVWEKNRVSAWADPYLVDTLRGDNKAIFTNTTAAQSEGAYTQSFTKGSFQAYINSTDSRVYWTFRKAPKFFDVVTYTGNGSTRTISHSLGVEPGLLIIKGATSPENWQVWHKDFFPANNSRLYLNTPQSVENLGVSPPFWGGGHTATAFSTGGWNDINAIGVQYVAYLFAHDPSADGIVQCGSFTTDGIGDATVNHGWAKGVQFALLKASSTTGDWEMFDTARTAGWSGSDARLRANLSTAEDSVSRLSASGTSVSFTGLTAEATYIYMFIVNP